MPKNSRRYRGPAELAERRASTPTTPSGRFGPAGRLVRAIAARIRHARPRREVVILGSLALALIIGIGSIGGAYLLYRSNHDWASVATVNGQSISREQLRGRIAVLALLAQERDGFVSDALARGDITSAQAATLRTTIAATTSLEAARQSLIDDELLRQLASRDGVATPASPNPWAEATADAASDVGHRVRYIRFGLPASTTSGPTTPASGSWPGAAAANVDATVTRIRTELGTDTPVATIVTDLHDAGWQVIGSDVAVSADGSPADPSLDLDPAIAAAALTGRPGDIVGPSTDEYGRLAIGKMLGAPDTTTLSRRLPYDADKAKLDTAALQTWADGRALRDALTKHLIAGWSKGVNEAHFRELVVGDAPASSETPGPSVELSALALDRLKGVDQTSIPGAPAGLDLGADSLAKSLKAMGSTERAALFRSLVAAANAASPARDSTTSSGEIGFYTKDALTPDVGKATFAGSIRSGDVIGPVTTSAGHELFLVEARYTGTLDDRSKIALGQIRSDPAPDPVAYAKQYSPADVALATDADWRAEPEFGPDEPVRAALFDTAIGALSDPFVLDGKLAVAIVSERHTAVPDARSLARLTLDGYAAWFAAELSKAKITESANPLPEPEPSASPPISVAPIPTSGPVLQTPVLPSLP
jgi:hypothetical protein